MGDIDINLKVFRTQNEWRKAVVRLARLVRAAQKEYFATRDKDVLNESKRLERRLDSLLEAEPDPSKGHQPSLFDEHT